jgi:hypothetical protein
MLKEKEEEEDQDELLCLGIGYVENRDEWCLWTKVVNPK